MIRADDFATLAEALVAASTPFATPAGTEMRGQIVQLSARDYDIYQRLLLPVGVTMQGEGPQATRIRCYNGGGIDLSQQMTSSGVLENGWQANSVRDLRLENQTATSMAPAILSVGGGGSLLERLVINGFGVGVDLWGCDEVDVDGVYIGSYAGYGVAGSNSIGVRFRGEANANSLNRCKFNGPAVAIAHEGGACNEVSNCRTNSGRVVISSANELSFHKCYWEGVAGAEFVKVEGSPGQVVAYGLRLRDCYMAGNAPAVRFAPGTVTYGFTWADSQLAGTAPEGSSIVIGDIYCLPGPSDFRGSVYLGGGPLMNMASAGGVLSP